MDTSCSVVLRKPAAEIRTTGASFRLVNKAEKEKTKEQIIFVYFQVRLRICIKGRVRPSVRMSPAIFERQIWLR